MSTGGFLFLFKSMYNSGMQLNYVFSNWLTASKISEETQREFNISFDNDSIIIPVYDISNNFLFNKYRRSPLSEEKPKYWYDKGSKISLYGIQKAKDEKKILLTEGEKDCLVAWSHNIPAVTSTGGASSFQAEWKEFFADKEVIICFDNDFAGANGMVKAIEHIPHAKILLIPDMPNVKDISDYVSKGGDLETLLKTARSYKDIAEVEQDRAERVATFRSVFFHDEYINKHKRVKPKNVKFKSQTSDMVSRAKEYPITNLLEFKQNKAICPFHNEKTPSFQYYPDTNTCYCFGCNQVADSIEVYKKINNCSFIEAVNRINEIN